MSEKGMPSVLVDTGFLISVYDSGRTHHSTAKKYYKYFLKNGIKMYLSTIVVSEFQQMQPVVDIINTGHYILLPFNFEDAIKAAEISFNLGGTDRRGQSQPKYKDDIKLMAQTEQNEIEFIITEDEATLARYSDKLVKARMFKPKIVIVSRGFESHWFNNGQSSLLEE